MNKELEVDIDFDEASREWRKNKIPGKNGCFSYRCKYMHSRGRQCNKIVCSQRRDTQYKIRQDWINKHPIESFEYCPQHVIRGPLKNNEEVRK